MTIVRRDRLLPNADRAPFRDGVGLPKRLRRVAGRQFDRPTGMPPRPAGHVRRRRVAITIGGFILVLLVGVAARPVWHITFAAIANSERAQPVPKGYADDASRLNQTAVAEVVAVPADSAAAEAQLVALIDRARRDGLRVSIAGARHSMGGHTISRGGVVIDMTGFRGMALSPDSTRVTVRAGTLWSEVIPFLDRHGRSLAVMQSNNSFTVGGSLSANVHGWQHNHAPIASTVHSFRLLTATGRIVRCSRVENRELFSLVLGGYGLFGVILDAELVTVKNEWYRADRYPASSDQYASVFAREVSDPASAGMAYGRLSVAPRTFLRETMLTVFRPTTTPSGTARPLGEPPLLGLKRAVFRGSVGSAYGKSLRWRLEKWLGDLPGSATASRNQILNEPVDYYANNSTGSTDVLHEYFVPRGRLEEFLVQARRIIPAHGADLLNVTIRDVMPDSDTFLPYAREPVFGLVMLFNQLRTPAADDTMRVMTRELVDAVVAVGGTYYLPYRLHPTPDQFDQAYPMARQFFVLKRRYDPQDLFHNAFYEMYGQRVGSGPSGELPR